MDFEGNYSRIEQSIKEASLFHKAKIRIGPELEISGYGCEDHFFELETIHESWKVLSRLLRFTSEEPYSQILCLFGMCLTFNSKIYNCGVFCFGGKIVLIKPKLILADDGIYRESRWFTPWNLSNQLVDFLLPESIFEVTGQKTALFGNAILRSEDGFLIGSECCEELWAPVTSSAALYKQGVHIVLNISGSHYQPGKQESRERIVRSITLKSGGVYMYSNHCGCDGTRLYFDGSSFVMINGKVVARTEQFIIKDVEVVSACVDLDVIESYRTPCCVLEMNEGKRQDDVFVDILVHGFKLTSRNVRVSEEVPKYLFEKEKEFSYGPACWLWDYLRRSGKPGFFLPLSGGADSASTLAFVGIMCKLVMKSLETEGYNQDVTRKDLIRIIGRIPKDDKDLVNEIMHTAYLSTVNSSQETRSRAKKIAEEVGSKHLEISMDRITQELKERFLDISGCPTPKYLEDGGSWAEDIALQNIQARSRMVMSYLLGQLLPSGYGKNGKLLVLASGNLEEGLTGYMTKYDCSSADINLIGGISKVDLKSFMLWACENFSYSGLKDIALAAPSAELKPLSEGKILQTDEEDLGLTYPEMSELGRLRRIHHLGPYFSFKSLLSNWDMPASTICTKVKRFYQLHGRNRHKMTVVTPSVHVEGYSADDNRFDTRPFLYNYSWDFQYRKMDELLNRINGK
jgi:NAD+ synthase (glutamine-hydrolysing)